MADAAPASTASAPVAAPVEGAPAPPPEPKTGAAPAPGAPAAETKVETKVETPNEARMRKLAMAAQRDREAANALKEESAANKARADKLEEFKTTKTPEKWLKENLGIEAAELFKRLSAEALAANGEGEAAPTVEDRVSAIESERAAAISAQETEVRAAVKAQLASSTNVPGEEVSWADKYELINVFGKADAVYDAVDDYCKAHPGMSRDEVNAAYLEAADAQEAALEAEHIEPAAKTKKFAKKFAGRPATETPAPSESAKAGNEAPKQTGDEKPKPSTTTLTGLGRSIPTKPSLPPNLSKDSAKRIRQIAAWQREQGLAQ